jgi:hypothetical protein
MKYTLDSQAYNDIFKNAQEKFDMEMLKREKIIENMSKKLMIINYTNEFINNKIDTMGVGMINAEAYHNNKLVVFDKNISGMFNQYGYMIHPRFKSEPIDIFNLKLTDGNSMFKNSLICRYNDNVEKGAQYLNLLVSDTSISKEILFEKNTSEITTISYEIDPNNKVSLGTMRFNVIEIDPYISGAYDIEQINIYTMNTDTASVNAVPSVEIKNVQTIGKTRIILNKKVRFSKVEFVFKNNFKTDMGGLNIYPFGLKHIHFYEANFLDNSSVVIPIYSNDYFEYIYNDITLYSAEGKIETTADYYNIEFYTDYDNNTLTGKVYTSSDAQSYRIIKNTKVLYAKVPLLWFNDITKEKKYLSLTGILFNYTTEENIFLL